MATTAAHIGSFGEREAIKWLRKGGYLIRDINWRSGRYELDIVAERWGVIHFIEVKSRKASGLSTPESAMTRDKFNSIAKAARAYVRQYQLDNEFQFDLVTVEVYPDMTYNIGLIERVMEFKW